MENMDKIHKLLNIPIKMSRKKLLDDVDIRDCVKFKVFENPFPLTTVY